MSPQEFRSLQSNLGSGMQTPLMAVNPKTGQMERVYSQMGFGDNGMAADTGYYFESDPDRPADASASFAGGYSTDNGGGGFSDLFRQGIPLTVGLPLALGAGASALGAGALGGGTAAEGAAVAGGTAAADTGVAGVTGLPTAAAPGTAGAVSGLPTAAGATAAGATALGGSGAAVGAAGGIGATKLGDIANGKVGAGDIAANATLGDLGRVLGTGGLTLASIYGQNEAANKYDALARDYMQLGAPSRQLYDQSFDPNFDITKLPGLQSAMDTSTQSILRGLSTSGNPWGNPGGLTEAMKYVTGNVALPALQNYRNQLASTGGYGAFSTAAPGAASSAINAGSGVYSDLGRGISNVVNPPPTLDQYFRQMNNGRGLA